MPAILVYLQAIVANFCHDLPTKELRQMWRQDSRIYHTHRVHPKFAHTVTDEQFHQIITNITKDPRCVGIGEFGLDYSGPFFKFKTQQIKLCEKFLQIYVEEEMFSKTLVIHCRDQEQHRCFNYLSTCPTLRRRSLASIKKLPTYTTVVTMVW